MTDYTAVFLVIGWILPLAGYVVGWWTTSRNFRESINDCKELREERRNLVEETRQLNDMVFELRRKVIELEAQLQAAVDRIGELSSSLDQDDDS